MPTTLTTAAANAMSAALNTYVNTGGTAKVRIYDNAVPANVSASIGSSVVLAEFTLDATAFSSSGGVLTLAGVPKTVAASATGTASYFRILNSANTAILQGNVGISGSGHQLILNTTTITSGVNVTITSGTVTVPTS